VTPRARAGSATLLLLIGAASACRFERRTDLVGNVVAVTPTAPEDSVRAAVAAVADAFAAADDERVEALTTPDAVFIDLSEDVRWTREDGGRLPRPLASLDSTMTWELSGESIQPLAEGVALYSATFVALVDGDAPYVLPAAESWIVVRTDAGWRVRHLHRSRALGSSTPLP
jgi:hypothetical protein